MSTKRLSQSDHPELHSISDLANVTTQDKKGNVPSLQQRMQSLVNTLCDGMYERNEIVAVALLGAMAGQNSFLYGPPGTAKSLISRRIACAFEQPEYFEYLMNRFSTPEEVFGPVSIKDLKEDKYVRRTESYLPKADFAFLDEIWKSSPAILNTLLTLINERTYRNGTTIEQTPLKALIAASNETPELNQGLEALFDRFIIRLWVGPIEDMANFECLLNSKPTETKLPIPDSLKIKTEEWAEWREGIQNIQLSKETLVIVRQIKRQLAERYDDLNVYVSDRRWQRAAMLMKAAAFFNDREETNHSDAVLLQHCLWTRGDNRVEVMEIVAEAIKQAGFDGGFNIADLDREKDKLDKEIYKELYYSKDIYETKTVEHEEYFEVFVDDPYDRDERARKILIPVSNMKSKDPFPPLDEKLQVVGDITVNFDGQGSCNIKYEKNYGGYGKRDKQTSHKIKILFHKGCKKQDVNSRLIEGLRKSVSELKTNFETVLGKVTAQFEDYEEQLKSPFVPKEKAHIAIYGISAQIDSLRLRCIDCDRLAALCL